MNFIRQICLLLPLLLAFNMPASGAPYDQAAHNKARQDTELPRTAGSFGTARKWMYEKVFYERESFYCGCKYDRKRKVDPGKCGLTPSKKKRANRTEAEHIFPAAQFGNFRACWRKPQDFPRCNKDGKTLSGRKCCERVDGLFKAAHNDLMNLVPAVGNINVKRSNYNWGMVPGEKRAFGGCNIEVDSSTRRVEPPENRMGDIARIMFYMEDTYRFRLSNQDRQLYMAWSRQDPPDAGEIERNKRIKFIQVRGNRFIEDYSEIFGKPLTASTVPEKTAATPVTVSAQTTATPGFSCEIHKRCGEMSSCEEARFYLTECYQKQLDGNNNGVPCESICNK